MQYEAEKGKNLEYWLDYIVFHNGVKHLSPVYEDMSFIEYYNILNWSTFAAIVTLTYFAFYTLCCNSSVTKPKADLKLD